MSCCLWFLKGFLVSVSFLSSPPNLGHDVSLKCVLSIGNVLQYATAKGIRVGPSVL